MEFSELIENRRSIRVYDESKKVSEDVLKELIYAAGQAPSWKNSQTGRYYCILSDEMLEKIRTECMPQFNAERSKGAVLIVTAFVKNRSGYERTGEPTNELGNGWGIYDLGLQTENLLLKAKELGLGTLVMGIRDEKKIRELLGIAEEQIIVSVIAAGYPAENPVKPPRKSVDDITKFY